MRRPRFEVYPDTSGGWRWRLLAANNRIIADSGEAYTSKSGADRAVKTVKFAIARADRGQHARGSGN